MKVRDVMTPHPVTVSPEVSVQEAAALMKSHGFRRLPVVKDGELVGIVTDRDLKEAMPSDATSLSIWEVSYLLSKLQVRQVMATSIITIQPAAQMKEAAELMLTHKISGLPVVGPMGYLMGIVTITDVLRHYVSRPSAAD